MFAAIRNLKMDAARIDGFVAQWEQEVSPHVTQQPGFQGILVLKSKDKNEVAIISWWDTEESLMAWRTSETHRKVHAGLHDLLSAMASQARYEVGYYKS
jgi:heme-degrading monooxygenase HmoA